MQGQGSSPWSAADAAFLKAMALRPRLPTHNVCWDDAVGDHNLISNWHAEAWMMLSQAKAADAAAQQAAESE